MKLATVEELIADGIARTKHPAIVARVNARLAQQDARRLKSRKRLKSRAKWHTNRSKVKRSQPVVE